MPEKRTEHITCKECGSTGPWRLIVQEEYPFTATWNAAEQVFECVAELTDKGEDSILRCQKCDWQHEYANDFKCVFPNW